MPRLPLYLKVLLWFFLNLALLAVVLLLLLLAQFRLGMDWLLATGAADRIQGVCDLVQRDLADSPRAEWDEILKDYSKAYGVEFLLFDNGGVQLAGERTLLPPTVYQRLAALRPLGALPREPWRGRGAGPRPNSPRAPQPAPDGGILDGTGPVAGGGPPVGHNSGPVAPARRPLSMVRTGDPTRYWALARIPVFERGRATPSTLVLSSRSLSGGLFFNIKPWLIGGLGAMVFSALLWFPMVRGITHSIAQMTDATQRIAEGHFETRVDETRRDELGSLGRAINQMAVRLAGLVAGQKRFLGDAAHELCSPLARLRMALGILEQHAQEKDSRHKSYVALANEKAEEMATLVNELLSFSKASIGASTITLEAVPLRVAVNEAIRREAAEGIQVVTELSGELEVLADPDLLVRVLCNLLRNAIRYAGHAGPIRVTTTPDGKDQVVVTVADSGPGIPPEHLPRVFDPFYRVDPSRDRSTGGVGLGMAIVKTCVEAFGGAVACRNRQPTGLEVVLRLRAASP